MNDSRTCQASEAATMSTAAGGRARTGSGLAGAAPALPGSGQVVDGGAAPGLPPLGPLPPLAAPPPPAPPPLLGASAPLGVKPEARAASTPKRPAATWSRPSLAASARAAPPV